jgi:hypothetical protein
MKIETEVSPGHRYGCHNTVRGGRHSVVSPFAVIDIPSRSPGQTERVQLVKEVFTDWRQIKCGHDMRISDPSCTGCFNREVG